MIETTDYNIDDFSGRIVSPEYNNDDGDCEVSLRPRSLDEYVGQEKAKDNLRIYIKAALQRKESLDHVLLYGPPGLGKTTLSSIIAKEMGVNLRVTSGPAIEKQGDLVALLTNLNEGDVLLLTKFTDYPVMSKKFFTLQWRIFLLI